MVPALVFSQFEQGSRIEGGVAIVEVDDDRAVAGAVGVVEMDVAAETAGAVDRVQEGERAGRRGGDQAVVGEGAADPSVAGIAQGFAGARYGAVDRVEDSAGGQGGGDAQVGQIPVVEGDPVRPHVQLAPIIEAAGGVELAEAQRAAAGLNQGCVGQA